MCYMSLSSALQHPPAVLAAAITALTTAKCASICLAVVLACLMPLLGPALLLLLHPQEVLAAPDRPLAQQPGYLARLGAFTGAARVKRLALKLMVAAAASTGAVDSAQLQRLKKLFQEMDLDGDGIISGQQLAAGLAQMGTTLTDKDLSEFLQVSRVSSCQCSWKCLGGNPASVPASVLGEAVRLLPCASTILLLCCGLVQLPKACSCVKCRQCCRLRGWCNAVKCCAVSCAVCCVLCRLIATLRALTSTSSSQPCLTHRSWPRSKSPCW
jgi:hypothetical protein